MTIRRDEVERVARLAALAVDERALPELTRQIGEILSYVAQLEQLDLDAEGAVWLGNDPPQPPRPDEVRPPDLQRPLDTLTSARRDGLFVVPRLEAMDHE